MARPLLDRRDRRMFLLVNRARTRAAELSEERPEHAFRVMTYNTHACVGTDRRLDLERVARVAAEQKPDLLALQELDVSRARSGHVDQAEDLARHLSMQAHFTCAFEPEDGRYGIAMLAADKLHIELEGCLATQGDEVRAAQWARFQVGTFHIDVVHTHLSVRLRDRTAQLDELFGQGWLGSRLTHPHLIVCGDLNALPYSAVYRKLSRKLRDVQRAHGRRARATWPARLPLARLDHIFVSRGFEVLDCRVPRNALTRLASDHLPVVADLAPIDGAA